MATVPIAGFDIPRYAVMWAIAGAMYGCLKLLSLRGTSLSGLTYWIYLLGWPGMNPVEFNRPVPRRPNIGDTAFAIGKMVIGVILLVASMRCPNPLNGIAGMIGITFTLHFGLFHLLALFWQRRGHHARPIMHWPILADSLSDFWGRRWNLAFRDLTHRFLFRPLTRRANVANATMACFLISGLIHELAITVPAGSGYGGPTIFFLLQGIGLLIERRLRSSWRRPLAIAIVLLPTPLLFPAAFLDRIIVPFLSTIVPI